MNLLNKLLKTLNIEKEEQTKVVLNNVIFGNQSLIILEIINEENQIIRNKIITYLVNNIEDLHWYRSYYEMECNLEYFIGNDYGTFFIIIG